LCPLLQIADLLETLRGALEGKRQAEARVSHLLTQGHQPLGAGTLVAYGQPASGPGTPVSSGGSGAGGLGTLQFSSVEDVGEPLDGDGDREEGGEGVVSIPASPGHVRQLHSQLAIRSEEVRRLTLGLDMARARGEALARELAHARQAYEDLVAAGVVAGKPAPPAGPPEPATTAGDVGSGGKGGETGVRTPSQSPSVRDASPR
jgi:hypothetical protein